MTSRQHRRAPLRRSSTPERVLSAGLATATCVGIVGLVGARTIEANTTSAESQQASASAVVAQPVAPVQQVAVEPTTTSGLTEADLDAYAIQLAAEKDRLDAYRAKLIKTATKLQRLAAQQSQQAAAPARSSSTNSSSASTQTSKPAKKPAKQQVAQPAAQPANPAPSQPVAKPKPQAQPAPAPAPAPAQQQAPQSNTKTS
ncbi:MAG: hypothetical protein NTX29_05035 [Actinobacteria bacterium]|nr:hypothetical protein [Actinomycetota bacterium]